jgi:phosphate transport system substrate-binding protein
MLHQKVDTWRATQWPRLAVAGALGILAFTFAVACGDSRDTSGSDQAPSAAVRPSTDAKITAGYPTCPPASAAKSLTAAGATFPFPLYSKMIDEYQDLCGTKINYQSVGSGAGITQVTAKTVDYGASDGILTQAQNDAAEAANEGGLVMIPGTIAPVAVVVNLQGVQADQLKLSGDVLADIYLKKITKWNDPRITALNSGMNLPTSDITVAYRSDSSGTTNIFTNYLTRVSPEFLATVGTANSVKFPGDVGAQGNDGVAGQVKQLPGAIGYVELAYAKQTGLAWVSLKNKSGNFIAPSLESASHAFEGVTIPDDTRVVLTDSTNAQAYPITSFTWMLVYQNATDPAKGQAIAHYVWWAIHDGQKFGQALDYPALPADAVKKAEILILNLKCGPAACLTRS